MTTTNESNGSVNDPAPSGWTEDDGVMPTDHPGHPLNGSVKADPGVAESGLGVGETACETRDGERRLLEVRLREAVEAAIRAPLEARIEELESDVAELVASRNADAGVLLRGWRGADAPYVRLIDAARMVTEFDRLAGYRATSVPAVNALDELTDALAALAGVPKEATDG